MRQRKEPSDDSVRLWTIIRILPVLDSKNPFLQMVLFVASVTQTHVSSGFLLAVWPQSPSNVHRQAPRTALTKLFFEIPRFSRKFRGELDPCLVLEGVRVLQSAGAGC